MKDILKRWYEGDLLPREEIIPEGIDYLEYNAIHARLERDYHHFCALLSPEQQQALKKMTADMYSLAARENYAHFSYGFRLGTSLLCEIF